MVYNPDYPLIVGGQQRIVLNIVKLGVAVLAFDPPGQGERTQYWDAKQNRSAIGGCGWDMETCTASGVAHQDEEYAGRQLLLTNVSAASVWLWDARRALDYLLSRREVDGARVGVVGCSGGGTQAAFLSATDRRLGPAAIGCYMSTLSQDLRLIGPTGKTELSTPPHTHTVRRASGGSVAKLDGSQSGGAYANWREAFHLGIDKPDLLEVRAPKPTLIMSTTDDPAFPVSGSRAAEREAREVSEPHECARVRCCCRLLRQTLVPSQSRAGSPRSRLVGFCGS